MANVKVLFGPSRLPLFVLAGLTACATTMNPASVGSLEGGELLVGDAGLLANFRTENFRAMRSHQGLVIEAEIRNLSVADQTIRWRFEWLDADGLLIHNPISEYTVMTIRSGRTLSLRRAAPSKAAVRAQIRVLSSRDVRE